MRNFKFRARELALQWLNRNATRAHGLYGSAERECMPEERLDPDSEDRPCDFTEPELIVVRIWIGDDRVCLSGLSWTQALLRVKAALPELVKANAIAEELYRANERELEERGERLRAFREALPQFIKDQRRPLSPFGVH